MEHDTCSFHQVQKKVLSCIKRKFPNLQQVEYFSECCTGQRKNFKNFLNLCYHKCDFGFEAACSFFATSHGKSTCDGIGGTGKCLTARSSLHMQNSEQFPSAERMIDFCNSEINGIHFILIRKEEMEDVRKYLKLRYKLGSTVPGTRTYHCFIPISTHEIQFKRINADVEFSGSFKFIAFIYRRHWKENFGSENNGFCCLLL